MFGFLRASRDQIAYRQAYARCCSFQHLYFGVESLVFLSYEAVFLYLCSADSGMHPGPPADAPTCCRLRTSRRLTQAADAEVARFCAAFGLLLGAIKLEDDVRDERSWAARLAYWRLGKRMALAKAYFSTIDATFAQRVDGFIGQHLELERTSGSTDIRQYARPTAEAFAYVFATFARRFFAGASRWEEFLSEAGRQLGTAIIAHDCAVDWHRDQKRGHFNPLAGPNDIGSARRYAQQCLARLGWQCADEFGDGCQSALVLRSTFDRLTCAVHGPERVAGRDSGRRPRQRRWSVRRRGDCDCLGGCCEVGGNCCEGGSCCDVGNGCDAVPCGGGGHDGACGCCQPPGPCDFLPDCWCGDGCTTRKKRGTASGAVADNDATTLVGMTGTTTTDLRPTGVASIAGKTLPARSESGNWVLARQPVVVVQQDNFGVSVRPCPPPESDLQSEQL